VPESTLSRKLTFAAMATYETRTRRFTRAEYDGLIELGIFQPGEEIELIGGELIVAEPQGAAHYTAIVKSTRALQARSGQDGTCGPKVRSV